MKIGRNARVFAGVVFLDQAAKLAFVSVEKVSILPFFSIEHQWNRGVALHFLGEASPLLRNVFLVGMYGYVFFSYFFAQTILVGSYERLRLGLTLFFAGVSSNVLDRLIAGAVYDFLCLRSLGYYVCFNLADVAIWCGTGVILAEIFRNYDSLWHPTNRRNLYSVIRRYQIRAALLGGGFTLGCAVLLIIFSYSYLVFSDDQNGATYLLCSIPLAGVQVLLSSYAAFRFAQRSAGPVYAFRQYVERLLVGERSVFRLREGDEHQELIDLANRIRNGFCSLCGCKHEPTDEDFSI